MRPSSNATSPGLLGNGSSCLALRLKTSLDLHGHGRGLPPGQAGAPARSAGQGQLVAPDLWHHRRKPGGASAPQQGTLAIFSASLADTTALRLGGSLRSARYRTEHLASSSQHRHAGLRVIMSTTISLPLTCALPLPAPGPSEAHRNARCSKRALMGVAASRGAGDLATITSVAATHAVAGAENVPATPDVSHQNPWDLRKPSEPRKGSQHMESTQPKAVGANIRVQMPKNGGRLEVHMARRRP